MSSYQIKQSSTECPLVFFLTESSDHITGLTGASPAVTLSKTGGSFASPAGAVTEIANGWYKVAANATDTNTLGPLLLHATAGSADPTDWLYEVVAHDVQDAVHLGLSALPNVASGSAGAIPTTGTGSNQIAVTSGAVTVGTNSDKAGYDVTSVGGSTAAGTAFKGMCLAVINGAVNNSVSITASGFSGTGTNGFTLSSSNAEYSAPYNLMHFTSGVLQGLSNKITGYTGSTTAFTFATPWPAAPSNTDAFIIVGFSN